MATRDDAGSRNIVPLLIPPRGGFQAPGRQAPLGMPPQFRWDRAKLKRVPGGIPPPPGWTQPISAGQPEQENDQETTNETISKDQTQGDDHEFSIGFLSEMLPEPEQGSPHSPATSSSSASTLSYHQLEMIDSEDIDDNEASGPIDAVENLKEDLLKIVGEAIDGELSSDVVKDRVIASLLLNLSRLHVDNEILRKDLNTLQDSKAYEEVRHDTSFIMTENEAKRSPVFQNLYRVLDNRSGGGPPAYFLDPPRLFKGDTKLNRIRGVEQTQIDVDFLESHTDVPFVVVHNYYFHDAEAATIVRDNPSKNGVLLTDSVPRKPFNIHIVFSLVLREAIAKILETHPDRFPGFEGSLPITYQMPYHLFYLYNTDLVQLKETTDLEDRKKVYLDILCQWMEDNCRTDWDEGNELIAQGQINEKHFNKLFRPNELIVFPDYEHQGYTQAMRLESHGDWKADFSHMKMFSWCFDGHFYELAERGINGPHTRDPNKGARNKGDPVKITDLMCFPLRFCEDGTKAKLIARGVKVWECRKKRLVCYRESAGGFDEFDMQAEERYMVDYKMYKRLHPRKAGNFPHVRNKELMESEKPPEDDLLACLDPEVRAFNFSKKAWRTIDVERLTDVTWNKTAFKQLVAPKETKELIQAFVSAHGQQASAAPDIIAGKGQGLLILLHGAPGTGKTLTAESIAEAQERPLYRITCGDIGTEPREVEKYLGDVLEIGKEWGCVVLLDEADVFLEERSFTDQKRNAIISKVFLRVLEYYDGILILTTNRVGSFDEAFKSRIQLALGYPKLNEEDRLQIWRNFIEMLPKTKERIDMEDLKMNLHRLAEEEVNGRQIRNIITMARHLAKFRNEMLKYRHMQDAVKSVRKFTEYLGEVKGGVSDDDWARADKTR